MTKLQPLPGKRALPETVSLAPVPVIPPSRTLFHHDALGEAPVTVVITSYNYETHLLDALESVAAQTLPVLDLIVVDDGSSDGSVALARTWMERHCDRFNRLILRQSIANAGLGGARNIGMDAAETVHVMQLDADNILRPEACETLLGSMSDSTAYAYPLIACFNEHGPVLMDMRADTHHQPGTPELLGDLPFNPLSSSPEQDRRHGHGHQMGLGCGGGTMFHVKQWAGRTSICGAHWRNAAFPAITSRRSWPTTASMRHP